MAFQPKVTTVVVSDDGEEVTLRVRQLPAYIAFQAADKAEKTVSGNVRTLLSQALVDEDGVPVTKTVVDEMLTWRSSALMQAVDLINEVIKVEKKV